MDTQISPIATEAVTTQPMVVVTSTAAQKFQTLLAEKNLTGYGLRIFVSGGGCSGHQYGMAFENTTEEGDFVFESNGMRVYLDSASAMYLEGANVDYEEGPTGGGFRIENPNATSSCDCGSGGGGCGH